MPDKFQRHNTNFGHHYQEASLLKFAQISRKPCDELLRAKVPLTAMTRA
jgi:hypothetical protein